MRWFPPQSSGWDSRRTESALVLCASEERADPGTHLAIVSRMPLYGYFSLPRKICTLPYHQSQSRAAPYWKSHAPDVRACAVGQCLKAEGISFDPPEASASSLLTVLNLCHDGEVTLNEGTCAEKVSRDFLAFSRSGAGAA